VGSGGNGGEEMGGGRWWLSAGEDAVGNFPSAVVGVGDSDSQTSGCFQAAKQDRTTEPKVSKTEYSFSFFLPWEGTRN